MRTKELKINGQNKEAVLVAGGPGFRIYTAMGIDGWVLHLGHEVSVIEKIDPIHVVVSKYVTISYQNLREHEKIKTDFANVVKKGLTKA